MFVLFRDACLFISYNAGVVKKAKSSLAIAHDLSRTIDGSKDEVIAAMSHISSKSLQIAHILSPVIVLSLFKKMLNEVDAYFQDENLCFLLKIGLNFHPVLQDCELLNMSDRPEKFIVTNIAIPPVSIRPSVLVDAGVSRSAYDLFSFFMLDAFLLQLSYFFVMLFTLL